MERNAIIVIFYLMVWVSGISEVTTTYDNYESERNWNHTGILIWTVEVETDSSRYVERKVEGRWSITIFSLAEASERNVRMVINDTQGKLTVINYRVSDKARANSSNRGTSLDTINSWLIRWPYFTNSVWE